MKLTNDAVAILIDENICDIPHPAQAQCQKLIDLIKDSDRSLHSRLDEALGSVLVEALEAGFQIAWDAANKIHKSGATVDDSAELDIGQVLDLLEGQPA